MSERSFRLPEAVFPSGEDNITPWTREYALQGLEAAVQRTMMKPDSYHICDETDAVIVSEKAVNDIARSLFDQDVSNRELADTIVANALAQYRAASRPASGLELAPQPLELPHDVIPVMLSA